MRRTGFVSQLFCQLLEENLGLMKDVEDRDEALGKLYETNDQLKREIVTPRGTLPPRKPSCSRRRAQPGDSLEKLDRVVHRVRTPEEAGEDEQVPIEEKAWVANSNKVRAIGKELVSQANELKRKLDQVSCGNELQMLRGNWTNTLVALTQLEIEVVRLQRAAAERVITEGHTINSAFHQVSSRYSMHSDSASGSIRRQCHRTRTCRQCKFCHRSSSDVPWARSGLGYECRGCHSRRRAEQRARLKTQQKMTTASVVTA